MHNTLFQFFPSWPASGRTGSHPNYRHRLHKQIAELQTNATPTSTALSRHVAVSAVKYGHCRSHSPLVVSRVPRPTHLPPLRATPLALEHGFEPDVVRTAAVAVGSRCREMVGDGRAIGGEGRRVPAARRPLVPGALLLPVLSGAGAGDYKRFGIRFLCCCMGC